VAIIYLLSPAICDTVTLQWQSSAVNTWRGQNHISRWTFKGCLHRLQIICCWAPTQITVWALGPPHWSVPL